MSSQMNLELNGEDRCLMTLFNIWSPGRPEYTLKEGDFKVY